MPQRKYSKEREPVTKVNKRVILPIGLAAYPHQAGSSATFRGMVDEMLTLYPELFAAGSEGG